MILFFVAAGAFAQACSSDGDAPAGGSGSSGASGKGGGFAPDASAGKGGGGAGGSAGKGGTSGTGGVGASGGTGGGGGSVGDAGPLPVPCGSQMCPGVFAPNPNGGTITLNPCCSPNTKCGVVLDAPTASGLGLTDGCNETGQVGSPNAACPDGQLSFTFQLADGGTFVQTVDFPGCCRSDQTCGVTVDRGFLHLGCAASTLPRKGDAAVPGSCSFSADAGGEAGASDAQSD